MAGWGRCFFSNRRHASAATLYAIALIWTSHASAELAFETVDLENDTSAILVSGSFERYNDLAAFNTLVERSDPLFITFNSGGGNVIGALEFGRRLRDLGLYTAQMRGLECASACAFAFAGGKERWAQPGSIGVHKSSFGKEGGDDVDLAVSAVQSTIARVIAYLTEMGVDPGLLELALQYEASDIRYLSMSEMQQYRLVSFGETDAPAQVAKPRELPARERDRNQELQPVIGAKPSRPWIEDTRLPIASTGEVRHAKGQIDLRFQPDTKARPVVRLANRSRVRILDVDGSWYKVSAGGTVGYAHTSWIKIDQYVGGSFDQRFIQIKSYANLTETKAYIERSGLRLDAYLATNGWYAITLSGTYLEASAKGLLAQLKSSGTIPDDSYYTFGNTYARKVCCD